MRPSKLDPYKEQISVALAKGQSISEIARGIGVARRTLNDYVRTRIESREPMDSIAWTPTGDVTREEILQAELRDLRATVAKDRKAQVADERVLAAIEDAVYSVDPPRIMNRRPAPATPGAHHRQAVLLSDWHAGEVVDPDQVGGLNEFNWEVLERRVSDTVDALLSFKAVRPELTGLDIWLLGDMVSGDIHEELSVSNEYPVAEQATRVGYLIGKTIAELAPHYPDLYVCGVAGNHARTKKPHASKNVFDSWDWMAYQLAMAYTHDLANVSWDLPRSGMVVREIAGRSFLLFHGDGIRSSMPGVPAGGVTRRTNELRKQFLQQGVRLDGFACGHFHSANMWAGGVFINGSLIGTNEFGLKNFGGGEEPKQLLLTFDERKERITDVCFITPR